MVASTNTQPGSFKAKSTDWQTNTALCLWMQSWLYTYLQYRYSGLHSYVTELYIECFYCTILHTPPRILQYTYFVYNYSVGALHYYFTLKKRESHTSVTKRICLIRRRVSNYVVSASSCTRDRSAQNNDKRNEPRYACIDKVRTADTNDRQNFPGAPVRLPRLSNVLYLPEWNRDRLRVNSLHTHKLLNSDSPRSTSSVQWQKFPMSIGVRREPTFHK